MWTNVRKTFIIRNNPQRKQDWCRIMSWHLDWRRKIWYLYKLHVKTVNSFRVIQIDFTGLNRFDVQLSFGAVLKCVKMFWYAGSTAHQTRSLPHQFPIRASEKKTGNLWSCVWVCVFVPLWWSVCRSCCRSLISARIWGRGVSRSAPSPGFYLPPSGSDLELWTTDGRREKTQSGLTFLIYLVLKTRLPMSSVTSGIPPTCWKKTTWHYLTDTQTLISNILHLEQMWTKTTDLKRLKLI